MGQGPSTSSRRCRRNYSAIHAGGRLVPGLIF
jgi:hypothetical protein